MEYINWRHAVVNIPKQDVLSTSELAHAVYPKFMVNSIYLTIQAIVNTHDIEWVDESDRDCTGHLIGGMFSHTSRL